ncbi:hypothetical protein D5086_020165 [Populus alba]|uniref:Uncharacterized protein n=1 Tax=Populus alba TaxID=43335 RepID=A0ACC4BKY3_POPAL
MRTEVHRAGNFPPQRGMNPLQANQNPTTPPHPLTSQLQYPHSEKKTTQRSTLEDNFLPYDDASLSLGEAKQDLEFLKWQECSDQSIETVLFNHKTNGEVKSSGHDDALKSFVRSSQEEEKI